MTVSKTEAAHPLIPVLDKLIGAHEELLDLLDEHKSAIRFANGALLEELGQRESELLERISGLDQTRRSLMIVRGEHHPQMKITELAGRTPEPARTALMERARKLRDLIERARSAHGAIRLASESLMLHLRGVMQQIGARLSHAGTYGRTGAVSGGARVVTGLDVRS